MTVPLILFAFALISILIFYVLYRVLSRQLDGMEGMPSMDTEMGLKIILADEEKALTTAQSWYESTQKLYHRRLVAKEYMKVPLDEHNQHALWSNVERARDAVSSHQEWIGKLQQVAADRNIQL
ncbi:MAG: hypothetical protein JXA33_02665 [Anaerolineae bacterium]|nr:hypothetical protein [Anaerolineae bacterium]